METLRQAEIGGKPQSAIEISSNGNGSKPVADNIHRCAETDSSCSTTAVNDKSSSSALVHRATGPRTPTGKARSKQNAVKHGIFSKVALLAGESQPDFDSLLRGLSDNLQPKGKLEEILVEKLAILTWRYRRLLVAEGAEIRKGTKCSHIEKAKRLEEEEVNLVNTMADRAGLISRISNPNVLNRCLELLRTLEFSIGKLGFHSSADLRILNRVFGEFASSGGKHHIMHFYFVCSQDAALSEEERQKKGRPSAGECRDNFLEELKRQIDLLVTYAETAPEFEKAYNELDRVSRNVPDSAQLDRLLRYEASLERSFDRTLSQLERLQRMRLGQPVIPPINLNVSSS